MMRSLTILLLFAAVSLYSFAAKDSNTPKLTVAQLESAVAAVHAKPDADAAQQLAGLELNERLSPAAFMRLRLMLPGDLSRQALTALADLSEFLPLPATDIPNTPPLPPAEQRRVIASVVTYVTQTVHQLPNFVSTRATTRFEDRPEGNYSYLPLHFVARSSKSVIYRRWMDKLDIFLVERDAAGLHAQIQGETMGLRLADATYQKLLPEGIPFAQAVKLKPETSTLRVVVIDENSRRIGSITIPASALGGAVSQ